MKKKYVYGLLGAVIVVLTLIAIITLFIKKETLRSDNEIFAEEYGITTDNVFVYRSSKEIINILEKGTGVVYLGFPECPWCAAYVKYLNEVARENGIDKIYYFNIKEERSNNTENYQKIVSILKGYLSYDDEGKERIYVPDVTIVKQGEIVGHNNDTATISGELSPEEYWTEEMIIKLKEELRSYFKKIDNTACTDVCDK